MLRNYLFILVSLAILSACSSTSKDDQSFFRNRDHDYRYAKQTDRIKVPEGLSEDSFANFYPVPRLRTADPQYIDGLKMPPAQVVSDQSRVKVQTLDKDEWLLVRSSPSQLWPLLKAFIASEQLTIISEQGRIGVIKTKGLSGGYNFDLKQGFQRGTSELMLHYTPRKVMSGDAVTHSEHNLLKKMGNYFSDMLDKPSYSYVARGISTQTRMQLVRNNQTGNALLLDVDHSRAVASVKQALESASFRIKKTVNDNKDTIFKATYYPVAAEKPGFFARLFGAKADGFDDSLPYAGHDYAIFVVTQGRADKQKVYFELGSEAGFAPSNENREMTMLLKRHII